MKLFLLVFLVTSLFSQKPDLFLLKNYSHDINVTAWYMSEKLDGVRAYWNGKELVSRNGKVFAAPKFFTKDFPKIKLDGELWSTRGDFSHISSIVNRKLPHDTWKELTYNVFEVPNAKGDLLKRLQSVENLNYLKVVEQIKVKNQTHLDTFLKSVQDKGGEGLVVRDGSLDYYTGRNSTALKVKSYIDEECEVVEHHKGKGKYKNILGSLSCKMRNNRILKIGSGFDDAQRVSPPKIGAIITFKYYGLTSKGNPRFPVFLRERN